MRRILLAFAVLTALVVACGSSSRGGFTQDQNPSTPGGGPEGGVGTFGDAGNTEGGAPGSCSADLHSILDSNGNVVGTCPPNQGCAAGACIAPCDAAAANKSSVGCDYLVYPPPFFSGDTSCTGAFVANNWGTPITLTVTRGTQTFDVSTFAYLPSGSGSGITYAPLTGGVIPPGQVALVLLNQEGPACPSGTKSATGPVAVTSTGLGQAFQLSTDAPVVAYDIFPYGGGSSAVTSATLLIPTTAWGDNYVGTTAYPETVTGASPWIGIVANEDGTMVTLVSPVAITGATGVAGAAANAAVTYTLNKGQYVQLLQTADLTGTIIKATKNVGVWGGNMCAYVPAGEVACDGMHQQIPPVQALGSSYVAARYRNRHPGVEESPPWRILGAVDGTQLTYDPPQTNAPATIDAGKMMMFDSAGQFTVTSQDAAHPFFFAAYMTGCQVPGMSDALGCAGDPEFVDVVPPAQYLASYVFFTDPTYPETDLVFVRKKAADGTYADVTLDCVGTITGWAAAGADYQYTRVDLTTGNFVKQGTCDNGRHTASSTSPFGLTVWGWGSNESTGDFTTAVSYAYPAGASVQPINDVVIPAVVK